MNKAGEWMRAKRKALGMRQGDVARRAGVSVSYISTLERGQPHTETGVQILPDRDKLVSIAKALQADSAELLSLYGYAAPITEPQTVHELKTRLWELGVHLEFGDDFDDTPEDLERAKQSIAALMNAIFPPKK